jgi:hypothetical protein
MDTTKLISRCIHVRIVGHAGWILRSYLHGLCDHDIQACYRGLRIKKLSRALFGYFSSRNNRVAFSTSRESIPMGVKCRVYYLVFATDDEVVFSPALEPIFSSLPGARPAVGASGTGLPSLGGGACGGGATSWIPLYKPPIAPLGSFIPISSSLLPSLAPTFGVVLAS